MKPSRQQIIDLINQYIYTNGNQRITAAQLNQILITIANAFVIEGSGGTNGLEQVLEAGNEVTTGRQIVNSYDGKLLLSEEITLGEEPPFHCMGLQTTGEEYQAVLLQSVEKHIIGNAKGLPLLEGDAEPGEDRVKAITIYNVMPEDRESDVRRGITSLVNDENGTSSGQIIQLDSITSYSEGVLKGESAMSGLRVRNDGISANSMIGTNSTTHEISTNGVVITVQDYSGTFSTEVQNNSASFKGEDGALAILITDAGMFVPEEKRLSVSAGGSNPTAGVATLSEGTATVATTAVGSVSMISLTVQDGGTYNGKIRVEEKTPGTGFTISSSNPEDTCKVFWQIIDLT